MSFLRVLPIGLLVVLFGVGAVWRAVHQRRRFGSYGVHVFGSRGALTLGEVVLALATLGLFGQALAWAFAPALVSPLLVCTEAPALAAVGASVVLGALALMVTAQLDLGASWRIGIEEGAAPGLVTHGFYRFTRNPIFSFLFLALAGVVIALPSWLSLFLGSCCWVGVRLQVQREELYLLATYGASYRAYRARVGRFVPGVGTVAV